MTAEQQRWVKVCEGTEVTDEKRNRAGNLLMNKHEMLLTNVYKMQMVSDGLYTEMDSLSKQNS